MENKIDFFTIQDIWEENDKQIPLDCTKVYDPLHFWEDYGDKYFKSFKKMPDIQRNLAWILHKITTLKIDTLLDVGCGFGRLEPFLIDGNACKDIVGIDISPKQLACVDEYIKEFAKKDKLKFQVGSVKHLDFPSNSFDCVLSSECLQHLHLPSIRYALTEMRRVTRKYVVLVERYVYNEEHPQPHLWSHDYTTMAMGLGFKVLESKLIGNGIIGIILKK